MKRHPPRLSPNRAQRDRFAGMLTLADSLRPNRDFVVYKIGDSIVMHPTVYHQIMSDLPER